jgi:hypothetical protein
LKYVIEDKAIIHGNLTHSSLWMQEKVHLEGCPC